MLPYDFYFACIAAAMLWFSATAAAEPSRAAAAPGEEAIFVANKTMLTNFSKSGLLENYNNDNNNGDFNTSINSTKAIVLPVIVVNPNDINNNDDGNKNNSV